ncbi:MAG: amidohydrolase family protein [Acidimicrobiia bacterium]
MAEIIDADSHVYEPAAVWDHIPDRDRPRAMAAFHHRIDADGAVTVTVNGLAAKPMNRTKLVRQAIWRPGMTPDSIGRLDPDVFTPLNPGADDVPARLADMDAMGIGQAVLYPTLFLEYLPEVEDPEAAAILARAYNDWVWELAERGAGRLHPVAVIPLQRPDLAVEETERAAARGFRAALIRPAFYKLEGIEPTGLAALMGATADGPTSVFVEDAPYRPVWECIRGLGLVAAVHPSTNVTGPDAISSGGFTERVSERLGVHHTVTEPIAYMQDAELFMTAVFFHGLFEDLPDLKVAIAHAGTTWLPLALEKSETYLWLGASGDVCLEPEEVWDAQPVLTTFDSWETPVARMPDRIGNKAAWGSRYPHHDTGTPGEAIEMLERFAVDRSTIDRLMGANAAELFGLSVGADA